jgi:kojibiose phosphorylase
MEIFNTKMSSDKNNVYDPHYIIVEGFQAELERENETILAIGNGYIGTRNSLSERYKLSTPATFVAGIYEKSIDFDFNELIKVPDWTRIEIFIEDYPVNLFDSPVISHRRFLDLKKGIAVRELISQDDNGRITNIKFIKFISIYNKHEAVKTLLITPENYTGKIRVKSGIDAALTSPIYTISRIAYTIPEYVEAVKYISLAIKPNEANTSVAMSQKSEFWINLDMLHLTPFHESNNVYYNHKYEERMIYEEWEWIAEINKSYSINSLVSIYSSIDGSNPSDLAMLHLSKLEGDIYTKCWQPHITTWVNLWKDVHIVVSDDTESQRLINFALYHLITSGEFSGNFSSIPARTLTGEAYKGHIFWDTEMYLLPFYIFNRPEIAKALLLYRYNTLPGALENARKENYKGACYAWESTDSGLEMAPSQVILPDEQVIKIYSGKYENHISPDIAYMAWQYWLATHDEEFLVNHGAEMIFQTVRFCRSLLIYGDDKYYHINQVIGPDEYHELVNDNTYMNLMVQYNFEIAIKIIQILKSNFSSQYEILYKKLGLSDEEIKDWLDIKDKIFIGYNPNTKLYEQFKGYFDLEYVDLQQFEPRTAPMDLVLGREKIRKTQIIKQADVIMFLFLLANSISADVVETNYNYYEPRTSHGSSLSPGIHSIVAARLGKTEDAFKYFKQNAGIDLNNKMGNASGGIHIASMGAAWMSIVMGFAGMQVFEQGLLFDPKLPEEWNRLEFSIKWRKNKVNIEITNKTVKFLITGKEPIFISLGDKNWQNLYPKVPYMGYFDQKWKWK